MEGELYSDLGQSLFDPRDGVVMTPIERADLRAASVLDRLERRPAFQELTGLRRAQLSGPPQRLGIVGLETVGQTLHVLGPLVNELAPILCQKPKQARTRIVPLEWTQLVAVLAQHLEQRRCVCGVVLRIAWMKRFPIPRGTARVDLVQRHERVAAECVEDSAARLLDRHRNRRPAEARTQRVDPYVHSSRRVLDPFVGTGLALLVPNDDLVPCITPIQPHQCSELHLHHHTLPSGWLWPRARPIVESCSDGI